jgi:hypothetical protein
VKKNIPPKDQVGKCKKIESVKEEFTGKNLTSFGGAGLIRKFFKRHHLKKKIEQQVQIAGRRQCKFSIGGMLISLLYGMFLGYSRPGQMGVLVTDSVFLKIAGFLYFPVQSTVSRFLSGLKVAVAQQIGLLNFSLLMQFRKGFQALRELTLDLDSHVTSVFGRQQRAAVGYNPKKKGRKSYHTLLCFIGETRDYLAGLFRSGNHHTSYQAVPFLKKILGKLPGHLKKIRLRADSGFFSLEFLKFLVKRRIEFYVVVPLQPWVQKKVQRLKDWQQVSRGVEVGEIPYVLAEGITLRMVAIRKVVKGDGAPRKQLRLLGGEWATYDYQVIVTNGPLVAEEVWHFYNQRACCENFIKEGIYGLGLDKVISHSYGGNYTYFELLMLGYNLMNFFKEEVLNRKKVKPMMQTVRQMIFLVPGRLIRTGREWILKLEQSWYYREEFEKALSRVV